MNYIDLILIIVTGISAYYGWRRGFIVSVIEILVWLGSFIAALFISHYISLLFNKFFNVSDLWFGPLSFILILAACSRIIFVVCDSLSEKIPENKHYHWTNKMAGLVPGLFSGLIYALLLSFFLLAYPAGSASEKARESYIANALTKTPDWPGTGIPGILNDLGYKFGRSITVHPKDKEVVTLPFKTSEAKARTDLEVRMLDLMNTERRKMGIDLLEFDTELAEVARKHSKDMLQRGYFSHYTPEGKSPFDRIRKERLPFRIAGENLALAQNLDLAHSGLMESPVHKANILHKSFGRVGIGILDGGIYGIIVTQNFRN